MNSDSIGSRIWEAWSDFSEYISATSSCMGVRSTAAGSCHAETLPATEEYARYFLGCDRKPSSLQRMTFAHTSQVVYATTCEAVVISLPYLNKQLGGDVQSFATLQSTTAGLSVVGGIVIGALQDRMGTKRALLLAHASTLANVALLSVAKSWNALILAAIPGLTMHGFQAATQIAVLCSEPAARSVSLGRVAMSYGVGWFAGAALLSELLELLDARKILFMVVGSELVMVSTILFCYPQDVDLSSTQGADSDPCSAPDRLGFVIERISTILQYPGVVPKLVFKFGVCLCGGMIYCMAPQFALDPFGFSAAQTSRLMMVISGMQLLSQGVIVPMLKEPALWKLQAGALAALGAPMLGLAILPPNAICFTFAVAPISIGWHVLNVIINSSLSCAVPDHLAGTMIGVSLAPMTATFLVSPMISAALFKALGFQYVAEVAFASLVGVQTLVVGLELLMGKSEESDALGAAWALPEARIVGSHAYALSSFI